MMDRPPINESEAESRRELVAVARSMLSGELPFIEGAFRVCRLRSQIGGLADRDEDIDAFVLIESETDHLPLQAQRHQWSPTALAELESQFIGTQEWASSFAPEACNNLISRFDHS